jgi:hypothetical protein
VSPPGPLSISYGHVGCLKARAFPPPCESTRSTLNIIWSCGLFEGKGVSTSRVSPPGPLSILYSHVGCLKAPYQVERVDFDVAERKQPAQRLHDGLGATDDRGGERVVGERAHVRGPVQQQRRCARRDEARLRFATRLPREGKGGRRGRVTCSKEDSCRAMCLPLECVLGVSPRVARAVQQTQQGLGSG